MTTATKIFTAEQLWQMPSDEQRHELVKGELVSMAPAGNEHGKVASKLSARLEIYVDENNLGSVMVSEAGFVLSRNPDTVRAPDVAFVKLSRDHNTEKFFEGAPDLAVEVISPTETLRSLEDKVDDYLVAGTTLVWLVNPRRKTVTVYRDGRPPVMRSPNEFLDGEDVVPGFRIQVSKIFPSR